MDVDMSPAAVALRLKRTSQLRSLCLELGKMKPVVSIGTTDAYKADQDIQPPISLVDSKNR